MARSTRFMPVLVREPDDLVRMAHEVRRELGTNDDVDGFMVALSQIQERFKTHAGAPLTAPVSVCLPTRA